MRATAVGAIKFYEFTVTKSATFVVAAKDASEARYIAESEAWDALDDCDAEVDRGHEAEADDGFLAHYGEDIPYSDDSLNPQGLTVAELARLVNTDPSPDESTGPVHWCEDCLHEPVQFDYREDRQLCRTCRAPDALAA